jgi:hypothetical protein
MDVQTEMIQPGWAVFASDGEVGKVVRLETDTLVIKESGLLRSHEWRVPRSSVCDVETGRVELSLSKSEVHEQKPA